MPRAAPGCSMGFARPSCAFSLLPSETLPRPPRVSPWFFAKVGPRVGSRLPRCRWPSRWCLPRLPGLSTGVSTRRRSTRPTRRTSSRRRASSTKAKWPLPRDRWPLESTSRSSTPPPASRRPAASTWWVRTATSISPGTIRLAAFSLNGRWPDTLAGNRPSKAPIRYFGHFFYTTGSFAVDVPEGTVRVEVHKGFEFRPKVESVRLAAGQTQAVKISLERSVPMAARAGTPAIRTCTSFASSDKDDATIFDLLEAEDVRMGMVLAFNENTSAYPGVMPEMATPQLRGLGLKSVRKRGDYQIISGQEYRNGVFGHLNLFLRDALVYRGNAVRSQRGPAVRHDRRRDAAARRLRLSRPRRLRAGDLGRPGARRHQRSRAVAVRHLSRHRARRVVPRA